MGQRLGGKLFNWLAWHDKRARELPRATSWLEYPYFDFARYRRLQPPTFKGERLERWQHHLQSGYDAFRETIAAWEGKIAKTKRARRVSQGLKSSFREQLAALVADTVGGRDGIADYRKRKEHEQRLRKLAAEVPRRQRVREKKLLKARSALQDLIHYEEGLDQYLDRNLLWAAQKSLKCLPDEPYTPDLDSLRNVRLDPEFYAIPEPAVDSSMVRLYWFFRHGCKLSGDESEVRVALIRNAFWLNYGVPKLAYRPKYRNGESKGCDAVRIAVRRFLPTRVQPAK